MSAFDRITDAEFQVMDALWGLGRGAALDVAGELKAQKGWSDKTVRTLLRRLEEKGAVRHQSDGRRFIYEPAIDRAAYERAAANDLSEKVFGGRVAPLVAHLAEGGALSAEDVEEIEAILAAIKTGAAS